MLSTQDIGIKDFFLYGEPPRAERGYFIHLETLDERSRPSGWNIRPHSHATLSHIFLVRSGGGVMEAERVQLSFAAPALLLIPARTVHAFHWQPESAGWVLTLSDAYLQDLIAQEPEFRILFEEADRLEIAEDSPETRLFDGALARLARELNWTAPGHAIAVEAHLVAILVEVLRLLQGSRRRSPVPPGPHAETVARFRAMIEESFRSPHPLETYADRLGTSLTRLRAACLKAAGQPPSGLIQARRLLEARRMLLYSNATIAETAYHLGYDDPAYFSRVFQHGVGLSPRAFRKRHFETAAQGG